MCNITRFFSGLWLLLSGPLLHAQIAEDDLVHWAYSAFFGTGWYEIGSEQKVYTLGFTPKWQWRESQLAESGQRSVGIEFRVPFSIGTHQFDLQDISGTVNSDNVSTISAVPGVEIEIPINERWTLKPLAYVGWGTEIGGDASAWIYWGGLKSRLSFRSGELDWALINSLVYAGYSDDSVSSGDLLQFQTGFDFQRPLNGKKIGNEQVYLNWHVGYTTYLNDLRFQLGFADSNSVDISDQWELGIAFSKGQQGLKFWRLEWDRVGLAYRFSSDRNLTGLRLVFRSQFDR